MTDAAQAPSQPAPTDEPVAVRITAADWNGHEFDGSPFNLCPAWLEAAIRAGNVRVVHSSTDYAMWQWTDRPGEEPAGPDDWLTLTDKGIGCVRAETPMARALRWYEKRGH